MKTSKGKYYTQCYNVFRDFPAIVDNLDLQLNDDGTIWSIKAELKAGYTYCTLDTVYSTSFRYLRETLRRYVVKTE